jgi:hypothetical protein
LLCDRPDRYVSLRQGFALSPSVGPERIFPVPTFHDTASSMALAHRLEHRALTRDGLKAERSERARRGQSPRSGARIPALVIPGGAARIHWAAEPGICISHASKSGLIGAPERSNMRRLRQSSGLSRCRQEEHGRDWTVAPWMDSCENAPATRP